MPRRTIAEETKQQVAVLAAAGHSTRQIESATGVSRSTVSRWSNEDDMRRLISEGRARIAARLVGLVDAYLDRVEAGDEPLTGTPLLIQFGIAQDKYDRLTPAANPTPIHIEITVDNRSVKMEREASSGKP